MTRTCTQSKKPALWLLASLVSLPQIGETIYTPALAALAHDIGADQGLVQSTLSIFFAGFATGVLTWGRVSDRIGRRNAVVLALAVYVVGCVICRVSDGIWQLLAGRFVQAFGAAACSVVVQAICREAFAGKERIHVFATIGMLIPLSTAIGPFVGAGRRRSSIGGRASKSSWAPALRS
ncbi:MFS transporter [Inquilinus limosus]|uniref:MFS transporter n=1 Tax=Inquilinus limosus TaxID=171674 RepID=UPI003F138F97